MKLFKKWLKNYLKDENIAKYASEPDQLIKSDYQTRRSLQGDGMNFTVYRADGGFVVEYNYYDKQKDKSYHNLHIVTENQDLGEALGKIVVFENVRR